MRAQVNSEVIPIFRNVTKGVGTLFLRSGTDSEWFIVPVRGSQCIVVQPGFLEKMSGHKSGRRVKYEFRVDADGMRWVTRVRPLSDEMAKLFGPSRIQHNEMEMERPLEEKMRKLRPAEITGFDTVTLCDTGAEARFTPAELRAAGLPTGEFHFGLSVTVTVEQISRQLRVTEMFVEPVAD